MLINKLFDVNYICLSEGKAHTVSSSQCSPADCYAINILIMETNPWLEGTKKDVETCFSAPIPLLRPSHCPYRRISNVKPVHAS